MSGPTSVEQVINQALVRIGYPEYIGSIYDGTKQADAALQIYSQTRDQFLRESEPEFAERNMVLPLLKQAPPGGYIPPNVWGPSYPSLPWFYEYAYPDDCLKVRSIRGQAIFVMDFDPQPKVFSINNDPNLPPISDFNADFNADFGTSYSAGKVLVCNIPAAILTYTGRIVDLSQWEANSIEALVEALGRRLAITLDRASAVKLAVSEEEAATAMAEKEQG